MKTKREIAREIYQSLEYDSTKERVEALMETGMSRSYAYQLLNTFEIEYMIKCFS